MRKSLLTLLAGGCMLVSAGTSGSIGFVRSTGDFRVDGSTVRGNSTVFDGNVIETAAARSVVQLDRVQITLAPESRARFSRDRTVLEKGAGLLRDSEKHVLEADSLQISAAAKDSVVQVDIQGLSRIAVAARSGAAQVRSASGLLLADLRPGMALSFDTQTGASSVVKLTGIVKLRDGKYFLTDATSNVTVQLEGAEIAQYVGKKVEITGSVIPGATAHTGASEVVQVTGAQLVGAGGAGAAAAGVSVAKIAIIGGVAVGGTVAGLAAAGTLSGSSSTSRQ